VLLAVGCARIIAIFTENVNWDEFALLQRAVTTAGTGDVIGGGRPGLGTLILVPFAMECRNAVDALVQARMLWTVLVVASGVAFWYLLRGVLRPSPHRWLAATTGLGLWVLAPPFLRFSTQVRTDQPAILFGLLGGLALMASRRRLWWGLGAGMLLGIGFLFSQKLLYVAALVGILAAGQLLIRNELKVRREALRTALVAIGFLLVVLGYRQLVQAVAGAPTLLPVGGALTTFEHYREVVGWRFYRGMLPLVVPQLVAIGALAALTVVAVGRETRNRSMRELAVGWVVIYAGVAVAWFHAGRFPYFLMVLGLFPAVVGALVTDVALGRVVRQSRRVAFLAVMWIPLMLLGVLQAGSLLVDTQRHQRESLAFVERNFSPDARGFNTRAAFACRKDPDPVRVRFLEQVRREFGGPDATYRARRLIEEFRQRRVAFVIPPRDSEPYPAEVREFIRTRYVHYFGAVHVAGRSVRGEAGWSADFEAVVPGAYVWLTPPGAEGTLGVNGHVLAPGETIGLREPGPWRLLLPHGGVGMLVLALREPPAPNTTPFFAGF
jgi:hypothetical protein